MPWLLTLLAAGTTIAAPLPVHVLVVADPADGGGGEAHGRAVAGLLAASSSYAVVPRRAFEERVGEPVIKAWERCAGDTGCWRELGVRARVEQVVLVEHVDDGTLGLRVVDVWGRGPYRQGSAALAPGGEPDAELIEALFFVPGALRIRGAPIGAVLTLDSSREYHFAGERVIAPLSAGKHLVELEADGHSPLFTTLIVHPGQETVLSGALTPIEVPRRRITRWTTFWVAGVAVTGAVALAVGQGAGGVAVAP